jgi:sortase A
MARRRVPRILRWIETPLLAAGLALLAFYGAARIHGTVASAQALREFDHARQVAGTPSPLEEIGDDSAPAQLWPGTEPDQSLWGKSRIAAYRESFASQVGARGGVLTIPKIDLRVPIFEGTADVTLNRGVGRIEGTAEIGASGNLGIAGHRDGFFRGLKDVAVGDALEVQSLAGTTRYRVTEILIVDPADVYVLEPTTAATLTLVTCYPFYFVGSAPQRYVVKAAAQ